MWKSVPFISLYREIKVTRHKGACCVHCWSMTSYGSVLGDLLRKPNRLSTTEIMSMDTYASLVKLPVRFANRKMSCELHPSHLCLGRRACLQEFHSVTIYLREVPPSVCSRLYSSLTALLTADLGIRILIETLFHLFMQFASLELMK